MATATHFMMNRVHGNMHVHTARVYQICTVFSLPSKQSLHPQNAWSRQHLQQIVTNTHVCLLGTRQKHKRTRDFDVGNAWRKEMLIKAHFPYQLQVAHAPSHPTLIQLPLPSSSYSSTCNKNQSSLAGFVPILKNHSRKNRGNPWPNW